MANPKKVLTIAGSDTSSGAGLQADLKTFEERNVYGMSVITVVVAMDPQNWDHKVFPIDINIIKEQIKTALYGVGIDGLKTGMLPTVEIIELVGKTLADIKTPIIVIDPVMVCKGTTEALFPENTIAMQKYLLPHATVVTPNLFEAAQLADIEPIKTIEDMEIAAKKIHSFGCKNVIVKGGKDFHPTLAIDTLYDGKDFVVFESEKVKTHYNHGAGCTFAASITAELTKGSTIQEALKTTKDGMTKALKESFALNQFVGTVYHQSFRI